VGQVVRAGGPWGMATSNATGNGALSRRGAVRARRFFLAIGALLFALHGLVVASASPAHAIFDDSGASLVASLLRAPCTVDANGGNSPPEHRRGHVQCCMLCEARSCDLAAPFDAPRSCKISFPRMSWSIVTARRVGNAIGESLIGWASTWSSRAPPSFS
jgi:hypothetical protein